jgi:hypothetical protein
MPNGGKGDFKYAVTGSKVKFLQDVYQSEGR